MLLPHSQVIPVEFNLAVRVKGKVIAYAVFTDDPYYHLVMSARGYNRTLCGLSTKGSRRNVREYRPPGLITKDPPEAGYNPCPSCYAASAQLYKPRQQ